MTSCQRIAEAKNNNRGLHYVIEVYVPLCQGFRGEYSKNQNKQKRLLLKSIFDEMCSAIRCKPLNGEVRCYLDLDGEKNV